MKKLSLILGWMLAWHGFLGVAQGQSNFVSTEKGGIRVEMWVESAEPRWDRLVVCCSITNLRSTLYVVDVGSGSGTPPLYVTLTSPQGLEAELQDHQYGKDDFMPYGKDPFGIRIGRMFPGESLMVRFKPTEYFRESSLAGFQLTAFWNEGFRPMTSPAIIQLGLVLPQEPVVAHRPVPWRLEFTARELVRRHSDLDAGLPPAPPQSFKDRGERVEEGDDELWMQPMIAYERKERLKSRLAAGAAALLMVAGLWVWVSWRRKHKRRAEGQLRG